MGLGAGAVAGIAAGVGGVASAGASLLGSSKASSAANQAAQLQAQQFAQTQGTLKPFVNAGASVLPDLTSLAQSGPYGPGGVNYLAPLANLQPPTMTQADLEATPGYQFTRQQGLLATQSSAAARGLGVSGAAMKGAAAYATGLADSTYKDQFNIAQQQYLDKYNLGMGLNTAQQGNLQNQFSRLQNTASLGESAGAQTGTLGTAAAQNQGNLLLQGGAASAAGTAGVGSAATGAASNIIGNNLTNALLARQNLINPSTTGNIGPSTAAVPSADPMNIFTN